MPKRLVRVQPSYLLATIALAVSLVLVACGDDDGAAIESIRVQAEVLESDVPVTVEATELGAEVEGGRSHHVRVTWTGDQPVRLDDARFARHVQAQEGEGDLVTVGRGCSAAWDGALSQACTDDYQLINLESGGSHEYPVTVVLEVGPLRLEPGTYVVEEPVQWWSPPTDDPANPPPGTMTIRLTYVVE